MDEMMIDPFSEKPYKTAEDELILGLLRGPRLIGKYRSAIEDMRTPDKATTTIIKAMLALYDAGRFSVQVLVEYLHGDPEAVRRVLHLSSYKGPITPDYFVRTALEKLKDEQIKRHKGEFGDVPDQR